MWFSLRLGSALTQLCIREEIRPFADIKSCNLNPERQFHNGVSPYLVEASHLSY